MVSCWMIAYFVSSWWWFALSSYLFGVTNNNHAYARSSELGMLANVKRDFPKACTSISNDAELMAASRSVGNRETQRLHPHTCARSLSVDCACGMKSVLSGMRTCGQLNRACTFAPCGDGGDIVQLQLAVCELDMIMQSPRVVRQKKSSG